jgi:hypothetical protein
MIASIKYRVGYKYQLQDDYEAFISLCPPQDIVTEWVSLYTNGLLKIRHGYAWNGADWAFDTDEFMRGSLVHDALYQLLRELYLAAVYRDAADRVLQEICLEDGMWALRAWWVYQGVRFGAGPAADPANTRPVLVAP